MKYIISIGVTIASGWIGWKAGKADGKGKIKYPVLAFLVCAVNVYIQQMYLQ